ncbi:DUF1835 domain-containing protein [Paenibacillus lautus]|uniref:DUF1835 domain-containing protein n=1 Tax=Paenibacillus lautus TaxID=1401 RepID=A0A385TLV5_PAELA|nr:DUF1835 domain-containing protein [Paenibacillus lautus]
MQGFGERENCLLLRRLLNTAIQDAANGGHEDKRAAEQLYKLIEHHAEIVHHERLQEEKLQTHVHIIFSLSNAGSLKVALSQVGKREKSRVLAFNECFSTGPIRDLSTAEGQQRRQIWLMEHDKEAYFSNTINLEHQIERMIETLKTIPESKNVVIWCADNAHDQTGLRFALYLLRERERPVHVVNVTQILKESSLQQNKGETPVFQSWIERGTYIEIVNRYGDGIPLDSDLRKRYESEWLELEGQDHVLRFWEEGRVIGCEEDRMDALILQTVAELQEQHHSGDLVKAGDVLSSILEMSRQFVSYSYIMYRIWFLVSEGVLTFKGFPGFPHQFSIGLSKA